MTNKSFYYFWEHIKKIINDVEQEIKKSLSGNLCNFRKTKYAKDYPEVLRMEYLSLEKALKEFCYDESDEWQELDQHKIAACFCASLINKKVFTFDLQPDIDDKILFSNYNVAYQAALRIIHLYLFDSYNTCKDPDPKNIRKAKEIAERLKNPSFNLSTPETSSSFHTQYDMGRKKALGTNDIFGIKLDLLHFADTLFWIEHYNRQKLEGTIDPKIDLSWRPEIPRKDQVIH